MHVGLLSLFIDDSSLTTTARKPAQNITPSPLNPHPGHRTRDASNGRRVILPSFREPRKR